MNNYYMHGIALIGMPGVGKSTIAKLVERDWNMAKTGISMKYVGAGDVARSLAAKDPETAACLKAGKMAPDDKMLAELELFFIENSANDGSRIFITDGFPRNIMQYNWLQERFKVMYAGVLATKSVCIERMLKRQRYDDNREVIEKRMAFYTENTGPLMQKYCDKWYNNSLNSGTEGMNILDPIVKAMIYDIKVFMINGWC